MRLKVKTKVFVAPPVSLASCIAAEDLAIGDYIAILSEIHEYLPIHWGDLASLGISPRETVQIAAAPANPGEPLHVRAICLPFVFVQTPTKEYRSLDVRMVRLGRLNPKYAKFVLKNTKPKTDL